jgi:hypothetical protein
VTIHRAAESLDAADLPALQLAPVARGWFAVRSW